MPTVDSNKEITMQKSLLCSILYASAFVCQIGITRETKCSTALNCRCSMMAGNIYFANCSSANLEEVPNFNASVRIIDLSNNRIAFLPESGSIPKGVIKLNMSKNLISHLSYSSFQGLVDLKELDLSFNHLSYNTSVFKRDVFDDLTKRLEHLNIKSNNQILEEKNFTYPGAIGKLENLRRLLIDGVENASFPEEYKNLRKLELLDLSGHSGRCRMIHLRSGMFKNFRTLLHLNLTKCNLRSIENGTFKDLRSLNSLDLSDNEKLSFRIMENVTYDAQFTNLTTLSMNRIHCRYGVGTIIFQKDLKHLSSSKLQELYLNDNKLETIEDGVLTHLPKSLRFFSVAENRFSSAGKYIIETPSLHKLEKVDLSLQFSPRPLQEDWLENCNDWRGPEKKNRHDHVWNGFNLTPFFAGFRPTIPLPVPPSLKIVYARKSSFHLRIKNLTFAENQVKELHLQENWMHEWQGPVYGLNKLEYLDLSYNMCPIVSNVFFDEFGNLKALNLSNNNLGFVLNDDKHGKIFKNLKQLRFLDLSGNRISRIPKQAFKNLFNLESLNCRDNLLENWGINMTQLIKLKHLDISYNEIPFLTKYARNAIDSLSSTNNLRVNMIGNTLRCSCKNLKFLEWMYNMQHVFIGYHQYKCRIFNESLVSLTKLPLLLADLHRNCTSFVGLIAGVMTIILLSSSLVIGGLLYRYRWKLRYIYYITKSKYTGRGKNINKEEKYEFDVFVSYANEESDFILAMLEKLETESGCKVCLHQRDFIPGRDIAENITNAVQRSRRTIIVLTNNYLNSYWCMFEFNMARMESIYKRDGEEVMFMIFYQHVPPRDLPLPLLDLIETNSYIEFPDDEQGQEVFWDKIVNTIRQK